MSDTSCNRVYQSLKHYTKHETLKTHVKTYTHQEKHTMDFIPLGVSAGLLVFYWNLAVRNRNFQKPKDFNHVIEMNSEVYKLFVTKDNNNQFTVWTTTKKRLFKISKDAGSLWHIQNSRKQTVATVQNSFTEKYIALNESPNLSLYLKDSPLNTTPSIIRLDFNLLDYFQFLNYSIDFRFGTNAIIRWVNFNYMEIITKSDARRTDNVYNVHKKVAYCSDFDSSTNSFVILFNYESINIEILLGTFLLSYLLQVKKSPSQSVYDRFFKKHFSPKLEQYDEI